MVDDSPDWPWPQSFDAVAAAPNSHNLLMENGHVRVVEVVVPPGKKEPIHTPRWPSVMMVDQAARIRYYDEDENVEYKSPKRGENDMAEQSPPETALMEPEGPHAVENIDTIPYHALRVELKNA